MAGVVKRPSKTGPSPVKKAKSEVPKMEPEDFYRMEDEIARRTTHSELEKMFLKESSVLKAALEAIVKGEQKEPLPSKLILHASKMRRSARLAQYGTAQLKAESARCLEQAEAKYLQLQNVNSEIQHLQKDITRCLQFSSGDENIDLVPEEEFYAEAPDSISQPEQTKEDEHAKHLARLNWELTQRKQMVGTLSEQEGRRGVLISDINGKEQRLKSLKPKIDTLIKAAKPVQDVLGVKYTCTSTVEQRALFSLLPNDLSVLYVQAEAYKDIMSDSAMQVTICGSAARAHEYTAVRQQQEEEGRDGGNNSDDEAAAETSDNRRARTVSGRMAEHSHALLQPHPIHLQINIGCAGDVNVGLKLQYLPELRVSVLKYTVEGKLPVYADLCSPDSLFDDLFSEGDGEVCPDPVGEAKLKHIGQSVDSFASQLGRPYSYVQTLTGAGSETNSGVQLADALQELVRAVRERVATRVALVHQLKEMDSTRCPSVKTDSSPKKVLTELVSFKSISEEDYTSALSALDLPSPAAASQGKGFHFLASFENRTSAIKPQALILVPVSYPRNVPFFSISVIPKDSKKTQTAGNNHQIQYLERFVNVSCLTDASIEADAVLLHQLMSFASRCDVIADLDPQCKSGDVHPHHLYSRTSRGRDGELPLAYSSTANSYTFQ